MTLPWSAGEPALADDILREETQKTGVKAARVSTKATSTAAPFRMAIEVVVIPVTDVDRSTRFYSSLGWRLDLDFDSWEGYRVVQFTPPGSKCSVIFGSKVSSGIPGSAQGLHLVVDDIEAARTELMNRSIVISEPFHDPSGVFHRVGHAAGPNPQRKSYASFLHLTTRMGNNWIVQEVTARLGPGLTPDDTRFTSEVVHAALHPAHRVTT
jgi:catechol 2,3-dioxygenase-like lactoylglutathione lyase family enzyme